MALIMVDEDDADGDREIGMMVVSCHSGLVHLSFSNASTSGVPNFNCRRIAARSLKLIP